MLGAGLAGEVGDGGRAEGLRIEVAERVRRALEPDRARRSSRLGRCARTVPPADLGLCSTLGRAFADQRTDAKGSIRFARTDLLTSVRRGAIVPRLQVFRRGESRATNSAGSPPDSTVYIVHTVYNVHGRSACQNQSSSAFTKLLPCPACRDRRSSTGAIASQTFPCRWPSCEQAPCSDASR